MTDQSPNIEVFFSELQKPAKISSAVDSALDKGHGNELIIPELINKLSDSSVTLLTLALRQKETGQELLAKNPEIVAAILKKNPAMATAIAYSFSEVLIKNREVIKLPEETALTLAVYLRQLPDGKNESDGMKILANNDKLTHFLLDSNKDTAVPISHALMATEKGRELLLNNEQLRNALLQADRSNVRKIIRPVLHINNPGIDTETVHLAIFKKLNNLGVIM